MQQGRSHKTCDPPHSSQREIGAHHHRLVPRLDIYGMREKLKQKGLVYRPAEKD